jgi:phosphate transport system protein
MERHFDQELENLRTTLTRMAELVDDQLSKSYHALFNADLDAAMWVIERDTRVDDFDTRIEQECQRLFAIGQPVAVDLRFLIAALKINNQLERIGDIAVNIAERVEPLMNHLGFVKGTKLSEMAEIARIMVRDSITAFIRSDAVLAQRVLISDDVVDSMNRTIFNACVDQMQRREDTVEAAAHILILSRHIERLADHATNIAEGVIFLVDAKLVQHHAGERETSF